MPGALACRIRRARASSASRPRCRLTSGGQSTPSASRRRAPDRVRVRIPWKRLTWVLAAAVPLAVVAGVVWIGTRDLSSYQARLVEQVRKVTGRDLAAKVPLAVKLRRDPAMVAEGVTLSNAPWASRPDLARVRKVTLYIDPVALLLGEVRIGRLVGEGAD